MTTTVTVTPTHTCEVATWDMTMNNSNGERGQITSCVILPAGGPAQSFFAHDRAAITVTELDEGTTDTDAMRAAREFQNRIAGGYDKA